MVLIEKYRKDFVPKRNLECTEVVKLNQFHFTNEIYVLRQKNEVKSFKV